MKFTAPDGTQLDYTDEGTGPAVIALAGLTRNGTDFDHVAPHLRVRVIRLDYRGRGKSDWADPATYTIPVEAHDALALMDHLNLDRAAILGTSRGGLIAMMIAATAKHRLTGVALNDIGPEIAQSGLDIIKNYVGKPPVQKTYKEAAAFRARNWVHFNNVPMDRWLAEVEQHYRETPDGLDLRYDPALAQQVTPHTGQPTPDLWPLFDAMSDLPLALIRGANSDLLTEATADEMQRRRPDMIRADIPDRGHVPFLDEPPAIATLHEWIAQLPAP